MKPRALVLAAVLALLATPARADTASTLTAIGYAASIAAGGIATAVNGSYLAFGEPAPRGWRYFGYVTGGVDVVWGGVILAVAGDRSEGAVVGGLALAVGAAAILTAYFVEEDSPKPGVIRVAPTASKDGAGLMIFTRF